MSTTRAQEFFSTIPIVTKVLLAVNSLIHIAIFFTSFPVNIVSINPVMIIYRGEYYRLISSAFVHGGLLHIGMNMSTLLAIGGALENKYGSTKMLFLTLWALVLSGTMFVTLIWMYAWITNQPGELNTSAVGYSGVLFSYALIEAFHSTESSRSVFGLFSVPTKSYPFILLVLIQVMMPNISWWGHLSGLLVGVVLISRTGVDLLMPSSECMAYLDQSPCCRPLSLLGGFVPDRDKELVHPYLDCAGTDTSSSGCGGVSSLLSSLCAGAALVVGYVGTALLFVWYLISAVLTLAGVPASALSRVETGCAWARQLVLDLAASLWVLVCRCQCPQWQWQQPGEDSETVEVGSRTSSRSSLWWHNGYSQIPSQDGDVEIGRQETAIRPTAAGTGTAGGSRVSPVVQSPTSGPYSSSSSSNTLSLSKGPLKPEAATTILKMKRKLNEDDHIDVKVAEEDDADVDSEAEVHETFKQAGRIKCPYLDTVNRQAIDFDSEKLCSVTLTNMNVYVCLVCGKYFQGRGKLTPAYTHSVQAGHFVFMNLQSGRTYCLPDNYEVLDSSLEDVQKCLSPKFSMKDVALLNSNTSLARDVHGVSYLPGFVGLNNLNCTDYLNSLMHALGHVAPFRDFWLQSGHYELAKSNLVQQFGLTLRKMWSGSNFKSTVSPQELVQELSVESKRRFGLGQRAECLELLVWLLGTLQKGLGKAAYAPAQASVSSSSSTPSAAGKTSGDSPSVVYEPFQGVIEVTSLTKRLVSNAEELSALGSGGGGEGRQSAGQVLSESEEGEWVRTVTQVPFSYLSLDIPACPLFRDSEGGLVIPQVPLFELLSKFDGSSWTDSVTSEAHVRRKYRILQLPRYLVLHLVRFTRNNFYLEKNPTIVTFPVKNLEMRDFLCDPSADVVTSHNSGSDNPKATKATLAARRRKEEERAGQSCPTLEQVSAMTTPALRQLIERLGSDLHKLQLQSIVAAPASSAAAASASAADASTQQHHQQLEQLRLLGRSVVERVQLFPATKYDLVANICHGTDASSSSTKGGVTVGDLNMLLGQSVQHKGGRGKGGGVSSTAASGGAVGSGSASSVNSGAVVDHSTRPGSAYTAASTVATNNRVLNEGMYKVHIQHKGTAQWFEIQDLHVTEVTPQLIGVSESNILIYEKKPIK